MTAWTSDAAQARRADTAAPNPLPALKNPTGGNPARHPSLRLVAWLILLSFVLRLACFDLTAPIRFRGDYKNAWAKGSYALAHGVVATYDPVNHTGIDYPPVRLYIKTAWVALVKALYGEATRPSDRVVWPMLLVNMAFSLASAVGLYFLCRRWFPTGPSLAAAACTWFNPAWLFDSAGWVQWDIQGAAPLTWSLLFLLRRRYFAAGLLLGLAGMIKGQMLIVAPWFLMVALLDCGERLPWRTFLKLLAGFAVMVFLVALPFTLQGSSSWISIYRTSVQHIPLASGAFNIPRIMETHGLTAEAPWNLPGLGAALTLSTLLKALFAAWLGLSAIYTARLPDADPRRLLGLGIAFAAMFAVLPGMHERYGVWAAGMLAPLVCWGWRGAVALALFTLVALFSPLYMCLTFHPKVLPELHACLRASAEFWGWAWLAGALALTAWLARRPNPTLAEPRLHAVPEPRA